MSDLREGNVNPETFYDIQDDANTSLYVLIPSLVGIYALGLGLIGVILFSGFSTFSETVAFFSWSWGEWGTLFGVFAFFGGAFALIHAYSAFNQPITDFIRKLGAEGLDPDDHYHKKFNNIVDEIAVAADIDNVHRGVIPTAKKNALSLGDRGEAAILVTEGALGWLRRDELQALVAHEMAHVVYGDSRLKLFTVNILSTFTYLNPSGFDKTKLGCLGCWLGPLSIPIIIIAAIISPLLELMNRTLSMMISQQREWRADGTAVEYSRDPLAMASALHKLGKIPPELSLFEKDKETKELKYSESIDSPIYEFLLMVPQESESDDSNYEPWFGSLGLESVTGTHPPLQDRINRQLNLANVPQSELESRLEKERESPHVPVRALRDDEGNRLLDQNWSFRDEEGEHVTDLIELVTGGVLSEDTLISKEADKDWSKPSEHSDYKKIEQIFRTDGSHGTCPDCGAGLRLRFYLGVPIEACVLCGGVALSWRKTIRLESRHRDGDLPERLGSIDDYSGYHGEETIPEDEKVEGCCPDCGSTFKAQNYGSSNLIVDLCPACNTSWFEEDELTIALNL